MKIVQGNTACLWWKGDKNLGLILFLLPLPHSLYEDTSIIDCNTGENTYEMLVEHAVKDQQTERPFLVTVKGFREGGIFFFETEFCLCYPG